MNYTYTEEDVNGIIKTLVSMLSKQPDLLPKLNKLFLTEEVEFPHGSPVFNLGKIGCYSTDGTRPEIYAIGLFKL